MDQLLSQTLHHVINGEGPCFSCNLGVEKNLEEQITEFLPELPRILLVDGFEDFIRLLEQIWLQGVMGLFPIPRAPVQRPKTGHESHEFSEPLRHIVLCLFTFALCLFTFAFLPLPSECFDSQLRLRI